MHDDEVVPDEIAHAILINDLLADFLFDAGKVDVSALQGVVHFFL